MPLYRPRLYKGPGGNSSAGAGADAGAGGQGRHGRQAARNPCALHDRVGAARLYGGRRARSRRGAHRRGRAGQRHLAALGVAHGEQSARDGPQGRHRRPRARPGRKLFHPAGRCRRIAQGRAAGIRRRLSAPPDAGRRAHHARAPASGVGPGGQACRRHRGSAAGSRRARLSDHGDGPSRRSSAPRRCST